MKWSCFSFIVFLFCFNPLFANPFAIDFLVKEDLSYEDYLFVQEQLRKIDVAPLMEKAYYFDSNSLDFNNLLKRCSRGIRQTLIDPQKGKYPVVRLEQI